MRFSAHTPPWATAEFEEMVRLASSPQHPHIAIIQQVMEADPVYSGVVWRGLEKRALRAGCTLSKTNVLAISVWRGTRDRRGDARIPAKEKEVLAARLAKSASDFASAWRAVASATHMDEMPRQIAQALDDAYGEMFESDESLVAWFDSRYGLDTPDRRIPAMMLAGLDRYADAVVRGAGEWGQTDTPLAKPNHPNADRLWFIRVTTESLHHYFETPMREEVLALTNIWFGESGLTANDLSEIAKVSELPKPWPPRVSTRPPRR